MRTRRPATLLAVSLLVAPALALATGPVLGQEDREAVPPVIVRITTPATAGTYTVDWQTLGGCDPGSGTSGMAGEVILTVAADGTADDTPEPGELRGTPDVAFVVTRSFCVYVWHASFVEATTDANCIVGPAPFAPDDTDQIRITLDDPATSCTQRSRIVVRLHPAVPLTVDDTDHNAILRSRFIATARRIENAPGRCSTRTGVSKVDDNDTPDDTTDDSVSIELRVVGTTADGAQCRYDVTLRVPRRLAARHGDQEHNVFEDVDPLATIDFTVGVVTRTIILLQKVTGDSGGANVHYELERTCGEPEEPGVPPPMMPSPVGGIEPVSSITFVELREGRFNITAALADDPSAPDAFDGMGARVLGRVGENCEATVTMFDLPDTCVVEETSQTVDLTRAAEPTIFEFEIACGDAADDSSGGETGEGADPDDEGDPGEDETDTDEEDGGEGPDGDGAG